MEPVAVLLPSSDTEFIAALSAAGSLAVVGAGLMVLANLRSGMTPKGETKRNLWAFFSGAVLIACALAYVVLVFRSLGT